MVCKSDPDHLGDGGRVCCPCLEVERSGILPARRITFKTLHGALPADDVLGDVWGTRHAPGDPQEKARLGKTWPPLKRG